VHTATIGSFTLSETNTAGNCGPITLTDTSGTINGMAGALGGTFGAMTHGTPINLANAGQSSVTFQAGLDNAASMVTGVVGDYTTTTGTTECVIVGGWAGV
jgi:hypothetical protein